MAKCTNHINALNKRKVDKNHSICNSNNAIVQRIFDPFNDVSASDYYYKPILWAVEKGITTGTSDDAFSPDETCSSAHIITFLYRSQGTGRNGWYEEAKGWAEGEGMKLLQNGRKLPM